MRSPGAIGLTAGAGLLIGSLAAAAPAPSALRSGGPWDAPWIAVPTAPQNVQTIAVCASRVDVTWDPVVSTPPVVSYNVYRDNALVGSSTTVSFTDNGVAGSTTYAYEVSAVDAISAEGPRSSPPDSVTTPPLDVTPPTAPSGLDTTSVADTQVDLIWTAASDLESPVVQYNVYRNGSLVGTTPAGTTTFSDTGLTPFTTYTYHVTAVNCDNLESAPSNIIVVQTKDSTPPTAPTALDTTAVTDTQVDLTWGPASDPESGIASYNVYRDGALVGSSTSTTFSDTGLTPFTTYSYEVSAVNGAGLEGPRSAPLVVTTKDATPPTAPTALDTTAVTDTQVDLTWSPASDPESGVASYNVYRDGALVGSSATTTFSDTGLTPFTNYTYEVSAVNGSGLEGPRSAPLVVMTKDGTPPTAPTALDTTAVTDTQVDLTWNPANDPESGVASYNVYRDNALIGTSTTTSFTDTGVQAFTTYTYEVSAVNGAGLEGPRSAPLVVTTPDPTPPTAPTGLSGQAVGPSRVDLTWTAALDPESGIASYNVYRDNVAIASTTATAFTDNSVQPSTTYMYEVSAVNGAGAEGPRSLPENVTTPAPADSTPPTVPQNLRGSPASPTQVDLAWDAASDPESGIGSYNVYRDGSVIGTTTGTTFGDAGAQPSTTYAYQVSAVNGEGLEGGLSNTATVTTPAPADSTPPTSPTGLVATAAGPTRVDLVWQASDDPESGIAAYRVYRDGNLLGSVQATAFADTSAVENTTYRYEVSAVNGEGLESPRSAPSDVTTPPARDTVPPAPPTRLRIIP